jgi:DNA-directed RNA polymerase specialized sigma24 family protein
MSFKCFTEWLFDHPDPGHVLDLLDLLEVSDQFPRGEFNALFRQQLARRAAQVGTEEAQEQLMQLHDFDFVAYLARSLRNAGVQDADIDPSVHDLIVRLLVNGRLFPGWDGRSPLIARFKVAVRNAILNQVAKRHTRRRRIPAVSIGKEAGMVSPDEIAGPKQVGGHGMIEAFRQFLRQRHGEAILHVFDHRLSGGEVRELVGPEMTSYAVKEAVKLIKAAAVSFAADDPELADMIDQAFRSEAETVARRFSAKSA